MESNEIMAIVFGCLLFAAAVAVCVWLLIECCIEAKEKHAKEEEEKAKLQCRVDKLEYYVDVLWWERENDNNKK